MTDSSLPVAPPKPRRLRLRSKITLPYALLAILAGTVAAYLMTYVVVTRLEERFSNQLLEAGRQVSDSVVRVEQRHLETWRLIAFTSGLPEAITTADDGALANIAGLAALNACQDAVDILDAFGRPVFVAHRKDLESCQDFNFDAWSGSYAGWDIIRTVAEGTVDTAGDKFSDLVLVDGVWLLYTAGPIYTADGDRVGTLLVGTYLDSLVRRLKTDSLADVTVFGSDGLPLATTLSFGEEIEVSISTGEYRQTIQSQGEWVLRNNLVVLDDDYSQVLGPLEVRGGQDLAVVGTALPTQWIFSSAYPARNLLMAVFAVAIIAILLTGNTLAARIVKPVYSLVAASQRVAQGDLTQQVSVESGDEIGILSVNFNQMVYGLRERERVKDLFGRYVGDEVAEEILQGNIALGGRRVEATVLFSDIRDFSSIAERSEPRILVRSLQEYFTAMISEVEIQHGLVNKFGGDSILALFGAPVYVPNHSQLAVQAAMRMLERLDGLNRARLERGEWPLRIGIGVNSGPMVVGNMGTRERAEFTAIGDAVNVASRLSDMNKQVPEYSLFISQHTLDQLEWMQDGLEVKSLGAVLVKGKSEPVIVHAVKGWKRS